MSWRLIERPEEDKDVAAISCLLLFLAFHREKEKKSSCNVETLTMERLDVCSSHYAASSYLLQRSPQRLRQRRDPNRHEKDSNKQTVSSSDTLILLLAVYRSRLHRNSSLT